MIILMLLMISFSMLRHGTDATNYISLNENWTLTNDNENIKIADIKIPSGIYSDLENANKTESILFSYNDVELRHYGRDENWIYSTKFYMTNEDLDHDFIILTFHGLDTVAKIYLNGEVLGSVDNMFRRYRFDVKSSLVKNENQLSIHFESAVNVAERIDEEMERKIPPACPPKNYNGECHVNLLRKMQASFAWDWGLAAPSMGIWKDVEIELYDSVNIRDMTYELSSAAADGNNFWNLELKIHIESGTGMSRSEGVLIYEVIDLDGPHHKQLILSTDKYGKAVITTTLKILKSSVNLWWPNGYGNQQLYKLKARWEDVRSNDVNFYSKIYFTSQKIINVGFRTVELIENRMDSGLSFYFKVNDIPIFMKGSNWIPAHILPEKTADENRVKELLQAARDAHMNMLRVWGGGVYESDYFYELADKYGILIWQDMMFACAMYPTVGQFLETVRYEIRDQIKRIQHHPSIALFATNNENEVALRQNWYGTNSNYSAYARDYKQLYIDTIIKEIRKHDKKRKVLASSPSNGDWNKDRDEFGISMDPQSSHYGDIHYYPVTTNSWNPTTFHTARFSSEYGFQSYPQGWSEVARHGIDNIDDLIRHRQHHPLNSTLIAGLIESNLLNVDFVSLDWQEQVFLSQLSQAIALKTETEVYRCGRGEFMETMGALYWQLNDVWVAPSWSSIEFNGNYKIVHYWMSKIFAPISLVTQVKLLNKLNIDAISDEINVEAKAMTVRMSVHKWSDFDVVKKLEWNFQMQPNSVSHVKTLDLYKFMNDNGYDVYEHLLMFYLYDDHNRSNPIAENFIFPANYQHLKHIRDPKLKYEFSSNKCENGQHRISITVKAECPAIFVYIVLDHPDIKKYKLSKNGFIQVEPITAVQLTFDNADCKSTVTVESLTCKFLNNYLM